MDHDVIIVGGSFAGLSAALQLARARRRVLLVDAGQPRNRFARSSHGFLGQDGRTPLEIVTEGRRQLAAYPTVEFVDGAAASARRLNPGFAVTLSHGRERTASCLILAIGIQDVLPSLSGISDRWGRSVVHCPYCHGYELRDKPLGVLGVHANSLHQALLIPDWGPTTYFSQGLFEPDEAQAAQLAARGVHIERTPVVELLGQAPELDGVRLADGRMLPIRGLFTATQTLMASPLAEQLDCAFDEGPAGRYIRVDELKQTSVPGVFAAGDAATAMGNATLASAAGMMAGVSAHRSLVMAAAGVTAAAH